MILVTVTALFPGSSRSDYSPALCGATSEAPPRITEENFGAGIDWCFDGERLHIANNSEGVIRLDLSGDYTSYRRDSFSGDLAAVLLRTQPEDVLPPTYRASFVVGDGGAVVRRVLLEDLTRTHYLATTSAVAAGAVNPVVGAADAILAFIAEAEEALVEYHNCRILRAGRMFNGQICAAEFGWDMSFAFGRSAVDLVPFIDAEALRVVLLGLDSSRVVDVLQDLGPDGTLEVAPSAGTNPTPVATSVPDADPTPPPGAAPLPGRLDGDEAILVRVDDWGDQESGSYLLDYSSGEITYETQARLDRVVAVGPTSLVASTGTLMAFGQLVAFDASTGELAWTWPLPASLSQASRLVGTASGVLVAAEDAAGAGREFIHLDGTGTVLWTISASADARIDVLNDTILLQEPEQPTVIVDPETGVLDESIGAELSLRPVLTARAGDADVVVVSQGPPWRVFVARGPDLELAWETEDGVFGAATAAEGRLFVFHRGDSGPGHLTAVDLEGGGAAWTAAVPRSQAISHAVPSNDERPGVVVTRSAGVMGGEWTARSIVTGEVVWTQPRDSSREIYFGDSSALPIVPGTRASLVPGARSDPQSAWLKSSPTGLQIVDPATFTETLGYEHLREHVLADDDWLYLGFERTTVRQFEVDDGETMYPREALALIGPEGRTEWTTELPGYEPLRPAVRATDGHILVFFDSPVAFGLSPRIVAVDSATGTEIWEILILELVESATEEPRPSPTAVEGDRISFDVDCEDLAASGQAFVETVRATAAFADAPVWADVPGFADQARAMFRHAGDSCGAAFVHELARADVHMGLVGNTFRLLELLGTDIADQFAQVSPPTVEVGLPCPNAPDDGSWGITFTEFWGKTDRFEVVLCSFTDGDLGYYGYELGTPNQIALGGVNRLDDTTFVARNENVTYTVTSEHLLVEIDGVEAYTGEWVDRTP